VHDAHVTVPFLEPMFDSRVSVFGVPASVIVLVAAWLVFTVGALWLRHALRGDPEPRSFRATNPGRLPFTASLGSAIVISGGVLLALLALAWLLRTF
jgi:hypothetical protein